MSWNIYAVLYTMYSFSWDYYNSFTCEVCVIMLKPCVWYNKGRCRVHRGKCLEPRDVMCRDYDTVDSFKEPREVC